MWLRTGAGCGRRRAPLLAIGALLLITFLLLLRHGPSLPRPALLAPEVPRAPARLLPHELWQHRRDHPARYLQLSCSSLPPLERLQWAAASWQRHRLPEGSLYLYAAHWDPRPAEPLVRLLVYCDVAPLPNLTCQLWYEGRKAPDTVPAKTTYGWRPEWGGPTDTVNEPYILSCPAQPGGAAPRAVSVASSSCEEPRNVLAVQGAPRVQRPPSAPNPTSVAVCIKWLDYADDASADLVEWVELIRAFGALKLYVYVLQAHPNMRRVLSHYEALGFADVTELDQAPRERETGSQPSRAFRAMRRELLPLNDALYRAAPHYAWLAVFDMDELIVPLKDDTWREVIAREIREGSAGVDALVFRNYYFLGGAQRERAASPPAHMLADVWRARNPSNAGEHAKSFHNTGSVVAMHNHMPMSCLHGDYACQVRDVSLDFGRLQHYRSLCDYDKLDCPELHDVARDTTLLRFSRVLQTARAVLKTLEISLPTARPLLEYPKTEIITENPATLPEKVTGESSSIPELASEKGVGIINTYQRIKKLYDNISDTNNNYLLPFLFLLE